MSITAYSFKEIVKDFDARNKKPCGNVLTLSRYDIDFGVKVYNEITNTGGIHESLFLDDKALLLSFGFDNLDTMDYSDYEGAEIIHDLNNADIPKQHHEKYDYIIDGGTLEHVFHTPNALACIYKMLKVGGTFYFDQPVFDAINHGFYNFSPCLYYEYFLANNYQINKLCLYARKDSLSEAHKVEIPYQDLRGAQIYSNDGPQFYLWGSVTKTEETTASSIPYQYRYQKAWDNHNHRNQLINTVLQDKTAKAIYFYGAGLHAKSLFMRLTQAQKDRLVENGGMLSASPDEIGKYFIGNVKVFDISRVKPGDVIIIASRLYQDVIYDRIKHLIDQGVSVVKLY